jgi:Spy/CpxP family protein refolding chaperone
MKTTIKCIAATMLLTIAITVQAQQSAKLSPEEKAKREARVLKKQLSLTDEQASKCEQIISKYADGLAETKPAKGDSIKLRSSKQQLVQKRNNEIKAVLTPDQQTKFDKWMQEKQHPGGKAMKRDGDK